MPTVQPEAYADVGEIVKTLTATFPRANPPQVTPQALRELVSYLERVTSSVSGHLANTEEAFEIDNITGYPWEQLQRLKADLDGWKIRLTLYRANVDGCPPQDSDCTLWTVIAPLFYGYFDGEKGTDLQKLPDLSTPFIIGNQASELRAWSEDSYGWAGGYRDIEASIREIPSTLKTAGAGALRALDWIADGVRNTAGSLLGIDVGTLVMVAAAGLVGWLLLRKQAS